MAAYVSELPQKASPLSRFVEVIKNPTVLFCVIGLLITAVMILRFPNLGTIIAQYNQF